MVLRHCLLYCVFHQESKIARVGRNIQQRANGLNMLHNNSSVAKFLRFKAGKGKFKAKGKSHAWCIGVLDDLNLF